jgi:hypothetical protein
MWADRYLRNTLQLKFGNNVDLARVLAETLKICVNTMHCNSVGELVSYFPLSKQSGTCGIISRLLLAVTHSFEVTDSYLTKILRGLSHLF